MSLRAHAAERAAERIEAERLLAEFLAAGAERVEADVLQPAAELLDLYGEDIRARAYVTHDPVAGEVMLRPDFTVPVVRMHMAGGAEPARYAYAGPVFRRQLGASHRAREYWQVGFELFDGADRARADAEVFALFSRTLAPLGLTPVIGDIGLLRAAVSGLSTPERRKAALMRHLWRPQRFRRLLERFSGRGALSPARQALIERVRAEGPEAVAAAAGPAQGLRGTDEVAERLAALAAEADTPPLDPAERAAIERLLALAAPAGEALDALEGIARVLPAMYPALARFAARLSALEAVGIAAASLPFEASYGRTTLEYYDGFVFGFTDPARPDAPPVASGGRYDTLTRILGGGRGIAAVGGVIRAARAAELRRRAGEGGAA